jgi:signal peptidase II
MSRLGMVGPGRLILFCSIAMGGFVFDLVTKSMVFARIGPPPSSAVPIIPRILELHTSQNTGALWGFGANLPYSSMIFAGLSVVAAIIICYWLFVLGAATSRVLTIALALIMAGAMGNCYDRLAFGYVRDFVHFHVDSVGFDCAIFNFADNMLVAGALTLVFYAMRTDEHATDDRTNPADSASGPGSDDTSDPGALAFSDVVTVDSRCSHPATNHTS